MTGPLGVLSKVQIPEYPEEKKSEQKANFLFMHCFYRTKVKGNSQKHEFEKDNHQNIKANSKGQ